MIYAVAVSILAELGRPRGRDQARRLQKRVILANGKGKQQINGSRQCTPLINHIDYSKSLNDPAKTTLRNYVFISHHKQRVLSTAQLAVCDRWKIARGPLGAIISVVVPWSLKLWQDKTMCNILQFLSWLGVTPFTFRRRGDECPLTWRGLMANVMKA